MLLLSFDSAFLKTQLVKSNKRNCLSKTALLLNIILFNLMLPRFKLWKILFLAFRRFRRQRFILIGNLLSHCRLFQHCFVSVSAFVSKNCFVCVCVFFPEHDLVLFDDQIAEGGCHCHRVFRNQIRQFRLSLLFLLLLII